VIFGPEGTPHATLELATPSGLKGTITNWQVGDVIDFLNTDVTSFKLTGSPISDLTLTVTYDGTQTASYTVSRQPPDTEFKLQSVENGTDLILVGSVNLAPPPPPLLQYLGQLGAVLALIGSELKSDGNGGTDPTLVGLVGVHHPAEAIHFGPGPHV
jgi:hypothetical protein